MTGRILIAGLLAAVLFATVPASVHASPDAPMCVADEPYASPAPIDLVHWRVPMCGPLTELTPIVANPPSPARAISAYRRATDAIANADYETARLELDLASGGLERIQDRIALQSGRLELLREQPARAAEFFAEAAESPHRSVQIEASHGRVFALFRADDPEADRALEALLQTYPAVPRQTELLFEQARSLLRRGLTQEALDVMRTLVVRYPGNRAARWAEGEIVRLGQLGHHDAPLTDEERVRRARELVWMGPLEEARVAIDELLDSPLTGEQHAEVHYLAGRLARFEGRWKAAETYMRTAELFPMPSPAAARTIQARANDMANTARARDANEATSRLAAMRAGRKDFTIPSVELVEMIAVAAAAGLRDEVDALVRTFGNRKGLSSAVVFDAAMAAVGSANDELVIGLLEDVAQRPYSRRRAAALYHLARIYEEAEQPARAELFFSQAKVTAKRSNDAYYALWSDAGLRRLVVGTSNAAAEGTQNADAPRIPSPPRPPNDALADRLESVASLHAVEYPWIARAVDLLRVDEPEAATEELFEAYLEWRHAQGRPIARAGLECVARAASRVNAPIASDVRQARLDLSLQERETIAVVSVALGDVGTAGGFLGPDFLETLPRAYEWLAVPAANRHGLDPNLLLAVMRVESAYQKHIVSYAGAVGLMQIMPRTGTLIAHALDQGDFTPADLLDPQLNLEFAAWYLSSLLRRFDGHLPLAIAAYNGGPHNVRRWIQESADGTPLDVLLERIPFSQTHRYVRKVLVHYQAYREQLDIPMPQLSVVLPDPRFDPLAF